MATMNSHKAQEITAIFSASGLETTWKILHMGDVGFHGEIPEEEPTLEGNARAKCLFAGNLTGIDCFADDTGLEVEALGGMPGVHSARFAGEPVNAESNIQKLLSMMEGVTDRRARFRTVISLFLQGKEYLFEGVVEGEILRTPEGDGGFGYDPVFRPAGYGDSFAMMPAGIKNSISHRYRALAKMVDFLKAFKG